MEVCAILEGVGEQVAGLQPVVHAEADEEDDGAHEIARNGHLHWQGQVLSGHPAGFSP